jgi:hypothetical protein
VGTAENLTTSVSQLSGQCGSNNVKILNVIQEVIAAVTHLHSGSALLESQPGHQLCSGSSLLPQSVRDHF